MHHHNRCDNVRLAAAVIVVISHSFMLSEGSNENEPLFRLSGGQVTAGGLSVFVFFILSGYLITRSFERRRSLLGFMAARALRILPALAAVLVMTAFVAGPLLTSVPLGEYLGGLQPLSYVLRNLSLTGYADRLPSMLQDTPFPGVVNGSLWTLHIEAACYGLVVLLGVTGMLNRFVLSGLTLVGLAVAATSDAVNYPIVLIAHFTAGGALSQWRLPASNLAIALCAAVLAACLVEGGFLAASITAGAYLVITLAFLPGTGSRPLTGDSDLSYGIYLWAFPVQQVLVQATGGRAPWYATAALSLAIVVPLAWVSWHVIEKRALGLLRSRRVAGLPGAGRAVVPEPSRRSLAATGEKMLND